MRVRRDRFLFGMLCLGLAVIARSAGVEPDLTRDEQALKEAKLPTDGPGLVAFFRARVLPDADRANLAATIRRLGDDEFEVREQASRDLLRAGRAAGPLLQTAVKDPDAEIARRAARCLQALDLGRSADLEVSAARLLAARRPGGAAAVLLAYLPCVADERLRDTILDALAGVTIREGKAEAAVVAALADRDPERRAAAAFALGRAGPEHRLAIRRLCTDAEPKVRFHAALALARLGDREGVPALINLLRDGPLPLAWEAEDFLYALAGDQAPVVRMDESDAGRRDCGHAWEAWSQKHLATADLSRATRKDPVLGLTLVSELDGINSGAVGRVWEYGPGGKTRWVMVGVSGPIGVQPLPGGRLLAAEHGGSRVTERDRQGKVLWEYAVSAPTVSCQRLANGNTFIATNTELLEVTRDGRTVYSHAKRSRISQARKLDNGNILYAHNSGHIIEMDTAGKEQWSLAVGNLTSWGSVEPLPDAHFLVAQYSKGQVIEIDNTGKVFWECTVQTPAHATRLPDGRTLVASAEGRKIVTFDASGKEVARVDTQGRPFFVRWR